MHPTPRGFSFDIPSLRAQSQSGPKAHLWQYLTTRTRQQIAQARSSNFTAAHGSLGWHDQTPAILEAALLALLDHDTDTLAYIHQSIDHLAQQTASTRATNPTAKLVNIHSHARIAIAADLVRPLLSDHARSTLLHLIKHTWIDYRPGKNGITQYCAGSNIQWAHNIQAGTCALLWGADAGHPTWQTAVDDAVTQTLAYLKYGCDSSGFSFEGNGYGHSVFSYLFPFVELLINTNTTNLYTREPKLLAILDSAIQSLFPDQNFLTNDNDLGLLGVSSLFYALLAHKHHPDPAYMGLWHAYQGPSHPLRPYGDTGPWLQKLAGLPTTPLEGTSSLFYTMLYWDPSAPVTPIENCTRPLATYAQGTERADIRTSWSPKAVYANILGAGRSHHSQTHRHADAGHFSLFAHGDYLAIDTGRYNANEDQHNVTLINNQNAYPITGWGMDHKKGSLSGFTQSGPLTHLKADMAHLKNCHWADRTFLFINYAPDRAYLITLDNINVDNQPHAFNWQLHANQACALSITSDTSANLQGQNASLDLTFAVPTSPHTLTLRQDEKAWQNPYNSTQKPTGVLSHGVLLSSVARPRLLADVQGPNGVILAILSPRPNNQPPLKITRTHHPKAIELQIHTDQFIDTIITAPDRALIDTPTITALTELIFVRRDLTGKTLFTWTPDNAPITLRL
jgi:hypothetical protein